MDPADWDYPDEGVTGGGPWVRGAMVTTIDGAATAASGRTDGLGGEVDRQFFSLLRSLADVIVVGAGTARIEGYRPVGPEEVDGTLRKRLGLAPVPHIAVATRSGNVPQDLAAAATVLTAPIDWPAVFAGFAAEGKRRIVCEGGPHLLGELIALGLVDELCLTIAPVLAAGPASRIAVSAFPVDRSAELIHIERIDSVLLTCWRPSR
jgi:5-amino-6-(5-phosphoribosylamino)uracil reductase